MSGSRPSRHAHYLVRDTAEAMAHELYDHMMQNDVWYRAWKKKNPGMTGKELEKEFVLHNVEKLLPQARSTLAAMLRGPVGGGAIDELTKQTIYDGLLLDATLLRGRLS